MRLTNFLFLEAKKYKRHRLPHGHLYHGKHKIIVPPTALEVAQLGRELEIEERNMFYLRHSYLTKEESKAHRAALEYCKKSIKDLITYKKNKFSQPERLSEHLEHLRHGERWDCI
nr:PREDICTED: ribosomal protein 63, mitochondrial [Bemisia tabaci]